MMRLRDLGPFLLLDDARAARTPARLYVRPVETIVAETADEVRPALGRLREAGRAGLHAAGYLSFEAGAALEPRAGEARPGGPLLWFGLFESYRELDAEALAALLPDPAGAWSGPPRPMIARAEYARRFDRVKALITAGDIYQANLTFPAEVPFAGGPAALYARLRARAGAGHGALAYTGERWLLSLSPELFFTLDRGELTARPMKGTARRGATPEADAAAIAALRKDPKQRAENLMIVDLLRNDLSRVAEPGSVKVRELFTVETYPTIHQMTSRITARLASGKDAVAAVEALFPCGSVTGAPKIRAMQVISEVERAPRRVYTGSIGRLDANGDAAFNVAIRTLEIADGAERAMLGLGSGVVADSNAAEEWDECLAKGAFAGEAPAFDLIETMAFDPAHGIALLDRHMTRLAASARAFGFAFDRHLVRNELQAATFRLTRPSRVRLLLAPGGAIAIGIAPMPPGPDGTVTVAIRPLPVAPDDFRLRHKTSLRGFYDAARRAAGAWETVFTDPDGFLTEGSFTSIFVERDGRLLTPPLSRGLLPGVLRTDLIASGRAVEADLRPGDLEAGFWIGNAVRGLIRAEPIAQSLEATV